MKKGTEPQTNERRVRVSPLNARHKKKKAPLLGGVQMNSAILVNRPPEKCYAYWRDFENLPKFMSHVEMVEVLDDRLSHWVVSAPGDTTAEWDAEIIDDEPNERISWRSASGSQIDNAGSVEFSPQDRGRRTEVKVALTYNPPLGALGEMISRLFGESPEEQLTDDLVRFKEAVEQED